jgi:hypothetical protein
MKLIRQELRRAWRFVCLMMQERRSFAVEAYLGTQSLFFGAWLLMPWSTFAAHGSVADAYRILMALAPERLWGAAFMVQGAAQLFVLDRGGKQWRAHLTASHVLLWLTLAMAFMMTVPLSTATPMYLLPVLGGLWAHHAQTLNGDCLPQPPGAKEQPSDDA